MPLAGVVVLADVDAQTHWRSGKPIAALEHVANRPIAHHVLDSLRSAGVVDAVVVGHTEPLLEVGASLRCHAGALGLRFTCVPHDFPLGLAGGLRAAAPIVGSAPCIVHLADGMLEDPITPLASRFRVRSPDLIVLVEDSPRRTAGVCVFGEGALMRSAELLSHEVELDLPEIAECLKAASGRVHISTAAGWHRYAGDPIDLLELNRIALDRLGPDLRQTRNPGNRIEGRVLIDESACVERSVIIGPTVIGPGAHLSESWIGPYTSVGPGARIEGSEIERSIISAGASVLHVGGRLTASIVGRNARVFRDFSLPRALRLRVSDGNEVGLC